LDRWLEKDNEARLTRASFVFRGTTPKTPWRRWDNKLGNHSVRLDAYILVSHDTPYAVSDFSI
jgi:hypothetical protein